ncbi:bifunctional methylenetetrahydrofolate dehydrogenase/methenyltetrahydrofolate cyclohydrolase FolD [soil metagenome]
MAILFDGKKFANEKELILKEKVKKLKIKPKLVSILVGNDKSSLTYTFLKKKAAERIGVKFEVKKLPSDSTPENIKELINKLNDDTKVNGIMVQLPLPGTLKSKTSAILNTINKKKDVDGLTKKSLFTPATVKAVMQILDFATKPLAYSGKKAAVIGAKGMVGMGVVEMLTKKGYKVTECDKDTRDLYAKLTGADLVVSATGVPGLVKGEVIKEGVIAIDVGAPEPEFDKSVKERASFITPVPGGVGPVTIICLLENLVDSVQ